MEHTQVAELKVTVRNYTAALEKRLNEIRRLEGVNAELREALEGAIAFCPTVGDVRANAHTKEYAESYRHARAAIKAAKGDA